MDWLKKKLTQEAVIVVKVRDDGRLTQSLGMKKWMDFNNVYEVDW